MTQRKVHVTLTQAEAGALQAFAEATLLQGQKNINALDDTVAVTFAAVSRALKKLDDARIAAYADGKVER
jgi:hypothetical protein